MEGKLHEEIREALKIMECEKEVMYVISPDIIFKIIDKIKKKFPFFPRDLKEPKTKLDKKFWDYHVYRSYRREVWKWFLENFGSVRDE